MKFRISSRIRRISLFIATIIAGLNLIGPAMNKGIAYGGRSGFSLPLWNITAALKSQNVGGISVTMEQTPEGVSVTYGEGSTFGTEFYNVGLPKSVSGPGDARSFTYHHFALRKEKHDDGVWKGWSVEFVPDAKDRLGTLRITGPGPSRDFTYGYDAFSRLSSSTSTELSATATPDATGQAGTLTRGALSTGWQYDTLGRLQSITHSNGVISDIAYSYPDYDVRNRITTRHASVGAGWAGMQYDAADELRQASINNGRTLFYSYDAGMRGNRIGEGASVVNTPNGLDQIASRQLSARSLGVAGSVTPSATVKIFHAFAAVNGDTPQLDAQTGEFYGLWSVPSSWNGGAAGRLDTIVRGTLTPAGSTHPSVAEQNLAIMIPPLQETPSYNGAGRMTGDAFWTYSWDEPGRLTGMTRKVGALPAANVTAETLSFYYDADGRRVRKVHTLTYSDNKTDVTESKVLWAGWLPVFETRFHDGKFVLQRWFQWGPDLSGTLDGESGIGGLLAMIEEKANGAKRTLLPVQDGLGNVTAVLDALTGQMVARYDYGPFGEPLHVLGDGDACPLRYQTKWFDKETDLSYFGYRYYIPRLGRWISRDPLGEDGGFNLYAYCGNDPVNRHDALGLDWKDKEVTDKYWYVAGHGYLYTSHHQWVWEDGPATPQNLLLSLVKGLGEGAKHWGGEKIEEAGAIPGLLAQIKADPSSITRELGINSPSDVLELVGTSVASKFTAPFETVGNFGHIIDGAHADWNNPLRGPNYAMESIGSQAGPTVASAVVSYLLKKAGGVGTGSLARNQRTLRAALGNIPNGYAAHHLVSVSSAGNYSFLKRAEQLGYNINRAGNGVALPRSVVESLAKGLPLHSGGHLGSYFSIVEGRLDPLEQAYKMGKLTDQQILNELGTIENGLRQDLLSGKIRVQNAGWP